MLIDSRSEIDTSIIVSQHGGSQMAISCLRSIRKYEKTSWPMIVVDDGSAVEDRQRLLEANIENTISIFQKHLYLTAAWNRAAKLCETPYIVFLNNDVTVSDKFVDRLIEPLRRAKAEMTGVRFREEKAYPRILFESLPIRQFLEGWCFSLKKETFDALGGFDTGMKLYFSDTDLQLRIVETTRHKISLMEVPNLSLKHHGHRTAHRLSNHREIWQQDRQVFVEKWSHDKTTSSV